jgi:hypothetical protein
LTPLWLFVVVLGMVEQFFSQRLARQFESHFEEYDMLQKRKQQELWEEQEKKKKRRRKEARQKRCLKEKERELSVWVEEHFGVALGELYDCLTVIEHTLFLLEDILLRGSNNTTTTTTTTAATTMAVHHRLEALCHSILFSTPVFREILYHYFSKQFHDFCQSTLPAPSRMEEEEAEEEVEEDEEEREKAEKRGGGGESGKEERILLLWKLGRLGVIGGSEEVFTEILFDEIEATISRLCRGRFDRSRLLDILHYLDSSVFAWLKLVILSSPHNNNNMTTYLQWKTRLEFFVYETFADLR